MLAACLGQPGCMRLRAVSRPDFLSSGTSGGPSAGGGGVFDSFGCGVCQPNLDSRGASPLRLPQRSLLSVSHCLLATEKTWHAALEPVSIRLLFCPGLSFGGQDRQGGLDDAGLRASSCSTLLLSLFTPQNRMAPRLGCWHAVLAMLTYAMLSHRRPCRQHTHATDAGESRQRPAARPEAGAREGGGSLAQPSPASAWQHEAGACRSL